MRRLIASKLAAGELAIVYGHPERRLGTMPQVLKSIASAIEREPLVWRTTFTELARWWRWRGERRWLMIPQEDDRLDIQFDDWDRQYPLALEIQRGRFRSLLPLTGPRMTLPLGDLAYERIEGCQPNPAPPKIDRRPAGLKRAVQVALDWETVTPLDAIPRSSIPNRLKRGLRWWKEKRAGIT
jgi:hypothetical protein